jgi:hypothetical protein
MKKIFALVIAAISATSIGTSVFVLKSYSADAPVVKEFACSEYKTKIPGLSAKEQKNDIPGWAKGQKPCKNPLENGNAFAKRVMDKQYPGAKHDTGPDTEYNKIKKHVDAAWQ